LYNMPPYCITDAQLQLIYSTIEELLTTLQMKTG